MISTQSNKTIMTALFNNFEDADNSYRQLLSRGFLPEQITVMMSDDLRKIYYGMETETDIFAANGAGGGTAVGETIGSIIRRITETGYSAVTPGAGIVVAGPIAVSLASTGPGGITGRLQDVPIGAGIPEETVKRYQKALGEGGIILGYKSKNEIEANEVEKVWNDYKADHIYRKTL